MEENKRKVNMKAASGSLAQHGLFADFRALPRARSIAYWIITGLVAAEFAVGA